MLSNQKDQNSLVRTIEDLKSVFTEMQVAEFFIDEWECIGDINLVKILRDKVQTEGQHLEIDHHEITDDVINEVFQCRLQVLAMLADSSNALIKNLSSNGNNPEHIVKLTDILAFQRELEFPERFFDYIEWLLDEYQGDVDTLRDENDIHALSKLRNNVKNSISNFMEM